MNWLAYGIEHWSWTACIRGLYILGAVACFAAFALQPKRRGATKVRR